MRKLYLLAVLLFGQLALPAQADCPFFQKYLDRGDEALEKNIFDQALNNYNIAMLHCPEMADTARSRIAAAFRKIEQLKNAAVIAQQKAEAAQAETERQRANTQAALDKAQKLIDAFYFYKGRFALANKDGQFHFIDTSGEAFKKLDRWDEALHFKETTHDADITSGYARVKKKNSVQDKANDTYLLDTMGNQYLVGQDFHFQHYLNFNGRNHVVVPAASQYIVDARGITMTGWFYVEKLDRAQGLMGISDIGGNEMSLSTLPDGRLECRFTVDGHPSTVILPANSVLRRKWQHYAWVYDGSQVFLFLNGEMMGSKPAAKGTISANDIPFYIGRLARTQALVGRADEVTLWSRALSRPEIQQLMGDKLEGNDPGLELYYPFQQEISVGDAQSVDKLISAVGNGQRDGVLYSSSPSSNFVGAQVQALDLSNQALAEVPAGVFEQEQLTFLFLNNNKLTRIPPEIKQLDKLVGLDLSDNNIDSLAGELQQLKQLTALDLSGNRLDSLPMGIHQLQQLTMLDLSDNNLQHLPPEIGALTNLIALNLSGNQLRCLPDELENLQNLTTLYLNGNDLKSLPDGIGKLKSLRALYLRNNELTTLPAEIGELSGLTILDVAGNHLDSLTTEIGKLKNLITLDLRNNQLPQLPAVITELNSLQNLYLQDNPLFSLPSNIRQLGNTSLDILQEELDQLFQPGKRLAMDLSGFNLTELPAEVGKSTDLTALNLSGNQLSRLSPEITKLKKLTALDLSFNDLSEWPQEIEALDQLRSLDLSGNDFSSLPLGVIRLNRLDTLKIGANQLMRLPAELGQLTNLKFIQLQNNPLLFIPEASCRALVGKSDLTAEALDLLCHPENRRTLQLAGMGIKALPAEIILFRNLTTLDLSNNELTSLSQTIGNLKNLDTLNLSGNRFAGIPPELDSLTHLSYLDLSNNQLTSIPAGIGQMKNLKVLDLRGNPLATLPDEIMQLTGLDSIFLDEKTIYSLTPTLFDFINGKTDKSIARLPAPKTIVVESPDVRKLSPEIQKHLPKFNERSRAKRYFDRRKYDLAFEKQKEILAEYSDNFYTWGNLSRFALFIGEYQEAIDAAKKALELNALWIRKVESFKKFGEILNNSSNDTPTIVVSEDPQENEDYRLQVELGLQSILNYDPIGLLQVRKDRYQKTYDKQKEILNQKDYENDFLALANLSHLALFIDKPEKAAASAQKALDLNTLWSKRVEGYLVLSYIFLDQWTEVENIVRNQWDTEHIERYYKTREELEEDAGITVPNSERMSELVSESMRLRRSGN